MHRSILPLLVAALLLPFQPEMSPAQSATVLSPGDHVRLRSESMNGQFTVVESGGGSLTVLDERDGSARRVPFASIERLEVARGKQSRGFSALRGAIIGVGVGGAFGVVMGLLSGDDEESSGIFEFTAWEKAEILGAVFAVSGGGGGLVGGFLSPGVRWDTVEVRGGLTAGPAPSSGISLMLTHRF